MFFIADSNDANNLRIFVNIVKHPVPTDTQLPIRQRNFSEKLAILRLYVRLVRQLRAYIIEYHVACPFGELLEMRNGSFCELNLVRFGHISSTIRCSLIPAPLPAFSYSPRGPGANFSFRYRVSNSYKCRVVPAPSLMLCERFG